MAELSLDLNLKIAGCFVVSGNNVDSGICIVEDGDDMICVVQQFFAICKGWA